MPKTKTCKNTRKQNKHKPQKTKTTQKHTIVRQNHQIKTKHKTPQII